jgi:glycosyltransferase involved in cell wall biosynthesis
VTTLTRPATAKRAVAGGARPVILFTNSWTMGGMEEHLLVLANGLLERGVDVTVLCPPAAGIGVLRERLSRSGAHVEILPDRGRTPQGFVRRILALARAVRSRPNCVVHLHLTGHTGGSLVVLVSRLAGAGGIVRTEHLPPGPGTRVGERIGVFVRDRMTDRVICVSGQNRSEHIRALGRDPSKIVVVANCLDLGRYSPRGDDGPIRAELGIPPAVPIVGTVSRLSEERKGVDHFLTMAAAVSRVRPDAVFLIVGDGALRPRLETLAHTLGVRDRVRFLGERTDVPRLLAAMTVFVMPSLYEGGPYTVLEACAMGRPVVATPVGLVPDLIRAGENGMLAPIGDSAALARAVLVLLDDDALRDRLGEAGRRAVQERHGAERMIAGVMDTYAVAG